jgi:hypothetical protein
MPFQNSRIILQSADAWNRRQACLRIAFKRVHQWTPLRANGHMKLRH